MNLQDSSNEKRSFTNKADDLRTQLRVGGHQKTIDMVCELIEFLQQEAREANDSAEGNEVYRNQGEVRFADHLLKMYLKS